ncbi:MAG: hypothetical protein KDA69_00990 [Planctomycetaceae bacterium]|nr:hypothetical protein [Planctomycetaceae bacterium]MCA9042860.1 hypothetical protein [Planctomycetaceae bacterium]MCB9950236.1 hypothetical protein [Planctomycetaceae bacterium]
MNRFRNPWYKVKPVSEARLPRFGEFDGPNRLRGVEDRKTGQHGYLFYVRIIEWMDDKTVRINFGMYGGPLAGGGSSGVVYHFNGSTWVELDEGQGWIS